MPAVGRKWTLLHFLNALFNFVNNPVLAKPAVIMQIVCGIALTVFSGLEKSFTGFDSVPFYVVHTAISIFGAYCIFKNKTIPLFGVSKKFVVVCAWNIDLLMMCVCYVNIVVGLLVFFDYASTLSAI